jgi:hypothetical protein
VIPENVAHPGNVERPGDREGGTGMTTDAIVDDEGVDGYTTCERCDRMVVPVVEGVAAYACDDCDAGIEVELCSDCVWVDANGYDAEAIDYDWPGFDDRWEQYVFGPVLTGERGEPKEPHYVRPGRACDGCGSTLGGDRFDYVAVPRETVRREPDDDAA